MPDWESLWAINRIQGWDQGEVTPAVRDFLKDHPVPLGESLIVPGCGTGYDVVPLPKRDISELLGRRPRPSLGDDNERSQFCLSWVDMAPTSTAKAIEYAADKNVPNAHFETADFFTISGQQFDVLYDYTFACAIEPSLRSSWAAQVAALVRPGGYALVQMYPLREECSGPPYSWTVTAYCGYWNPTLSLCLSMSAMVYERRKAFEKLSLWRRRTPTQSESI
ncbi:hypothetical protein BASA84_000242 [Batrachochytrium salamandrivorans]|nr:hypothetical protein BASA84_000242 [Batrachochytrium salamandrivorans]